jgi:hypothetical protein
MRELEDAECSKKAMQYMSKMSAMVPAADERTRSLPPKPSPKKPSHTTTTTDEVYDDDEDMVARMKRLYGVSLGKPQSQAGNTEEAPHAAAASSTTAEGSRYSSNTRVIARRTEDPPDSPPAAPPVATSRYGASAASSNRHEPKDEDEDEDEDEEEADLRAARRMLASNRTSRAAAAGVPASPPRYTAAATAYAERKDIESVGRGGAALYAVRMDQTAQAKHDTSGVSEGLRPTSKEVKAGAYKATVPATATALKNAANYDSDGDNSSDHDEDDDRRAEAETKTKSFTADKRRDSLGDRSGGGRGAASRASNYGSRRDMEDKPWRINSTLMYGSGEAANAGRKKQRDVESTGMDAVAAVRNMYKVSGRRGESADDEEDMVDERTHDDNGDEEINQKREQGETRSKKHSQGATAGGAKRNVTVPRSPQFSKMSWQRRGQEGNDPPGIPPAATGAGGAGMRQRKKSEDSLLHNSGGAGRATSAPRGKKGAGASDLDRTSAAPVAAGGRDKRSVSSGRLGGAGRGGLY